MKIDEICFSPTGGTKKVSAIMTRALANEVTGIDLTKRETDFSAIELAESDVAVIAVPSYGGRVPQPAAERLAAIHANGARAILLCVYGNRAYEDTLAELQDVAQKAGFRVIAAVAAIAEHSIVRKYAAGRPDADDNRRLKEFALRIREKVEKRDDTIPQIPGNRPYKPSGKVGIIPKATRKCVKCGLCAVKCPVGAIDMNDPSKVDKNLCISCMRCVSVCPHDARKVNRLMLALAGRMLKKVCSDRKECELYI